MNKTELISIVHNLVAIDHPEVSKKAVAATLETLSDVILATVSGGGEVVLPNVAKIALKSRDARVGRNPRTGEAVQIPAKRVLKFTPTKALKDAVAEQDASQTKA
ncbi:MULTISPECIES: HU family DNA-binding protein [Deefgea]|uniref:Viral histone-like protein n=1 Tax=Deefgea chitinilytica TaxID=570276 RepID=A0ABS2C9H3_9NEIS|nr:MULTISPECIES: HU family DNA-binding protein [Deefgea]MBM5570783.1 HU family DNA-binding protein [Deefgea chitinilytica]MBM9888012.1 HU family DNA-binding protein [Deefgea sp. CFH1-16]